MIAMQILVYKFYNQNLLVKIQMYKLDLSENHCLHKQSNSKSKLKESKQIHHSQLKLKENDSKHMNAIRPYVVKQRKNSKRQIRDSCSPYELSRSKSKKLETSNIKIQQLVNSKQLKDIYNQLIALKSQYKNLKTSYNVLAKQKMELTAREETEKTQNLRQIQRYMGEIQKYKKTIEFLESQIDRIKKECFKIVESQKFKNKKLEETLEEKQLMITYLRSENQHLKKVKDPSISMQDNYKEIFFLQNSAPIFSYESYAKLSANTSTISADNILIEPSSQIDFKKVNHKKSEYEQDSLSFSRDRSKQFQSVHSLLSNNDQTLLTFTKKDIVVIDQSSSIHHQSKDSQSGGSGAQNCLTFENRQQQKSKLNSKSQLAHKKVKGNKIHTKRLQILTDEIDKEYEYGSCQTKKKGQKKRKKCETAKYLKK